MIFLELNVSDVKQKIWDNRKMILLLIVIFLLAMSVRSNLVRYDENYLFEPDAYYHARLIQELVQNGYINPIDPNVYYELPNGGYSVSPSLYHYASAWIYTITSLGQYNKESLAFSVQFLPIIFGALISIGMYFLGRDLFKSKKLGVISGFLTAVSPAFAYRTMAGAQGDNSLGFLWMVIGFIFLIRALKSDKLGREELINTLLAGIFFAIMVFTWQMNLLIPLILIPSALVIILYQSHYKDKEKIQKSIITNTLIKFGITLIIYTIASYMYGENWINTALSSLSSILGMEPALILLLAIIGALVFIVISFFLQNSSGDTKKTGFYLAIIALFVVLFATFYLFATVPDLFYGTKGRTAITSLVGEESVGVASFGIKYNVLLILPFVGLFALPLGMIIFKRKDLQLQIILWFWTIITLAMAWYKLKFTFVFGLGLVAGALLAFDFFFQLLKKYDTEKGIESKITFFILFFIMIIGVAAAPAYLNQFQPFANSDPSWIGAMNWIKDNTDKEANFFNWWGEGHQLAFVTERNFSTDNRNLSYEANKSMALFVITEDTTYAKSIVDNNIGADYIVLTKNMFASESNFAFYINNKVDYSDPDVAKFGNGPVNFIGCSTTDTNTINCGGNTLTQEQFAALPDKWTLVPTQFYNGQIPMYIYRDGFSLTILNEATNKSNLAKVWFNSDDTKDYYEEAYYNGNIKILKVK